MKKQDKYDILKIKKEISGMTNLLLKLFIKNSGDTKNPKVREAYGKLSGTVGIVLNALLFVIKFLAGTISGSISITADALNNLSDASTSVISLIGFKLSGKTADSEHPYGHARYEYLAGLGICVMILVIGIELLKSGISKIINPTDVSFSKITAIVLISSIIIKLWLFLFNSRLGAAISSDTLKATAHDSRNDCLSTAAVLIAAIVSSLTSLQLDGYMAVGVSVFILISGVELLRSTINPLLGQAPDKELVSYVQEKIMSYPGVLGTHDLMVHDYGPGRQFASVHVEMAAEADVLECHDVLDNIERDFMREINLHMVVHLDPIITNDDKVHNFRLWLSDEIKTINNSLSIHDLRMVVGKTHTNVIFDCVVPHDLNITHSELKHKISTLVQKTYHDYFCVITIDTDFAPINR